MRSGAAGAFCIRDVGRTIRLGESMRNQKAQCPIGAAVAFSFGFEARYCAVGPAPTLVFLLLCLPLEEAESEGAECLCHVGSTLAKPPGARTVSDANAESLCGY
jgi:hypothetical protein